MAYSWTPEDGMRVFGITLNTRRRDQHIPCPNCNGNNFIMNTAGGYGRCPQCDFRADVPGYGARQRGITTAEARRVIEDYLGYDKDAWKKDKRERIVYNTEPKKDDKIAPPEVLDSTYRAFLSNLKLKDSGRFEMKARCAMDDNTLEALNYKTNPQWENTNFFAICKNLLAAGHTLEGVPGFYKAKKGAGDWTFTRATEGILMPLVNHKNQIVGLQLRKDDEKRVYTNEGDKLKLESKCAWFTSNSLASGTAAKCGIHYACDFKYDADEKCYKPIFPDHGVVVTEGIMKADIIHYLMPNLPVLGVQGVQNTKSLAEELNRVKGMGVDTVMLAYDMDYLTNPNVEKALEATREIIVKAGLNFMSETWETKIDGNADVYLKGLDDYLAFALRGIVPKVKHLQPDFLPVEEE